jgi:cysteine desulfurase
MDLIYLDHAATTPTAPEVVEAMAPWWHDLTGNASSVSHQAGTRARQAVNEARELIADRLHCYPDELIFTSGATEANNLALKGLLSHRPEQLRLLTQATEHRSILDTARWLQRQGVQLEIAPVNHKGVVELEVWEEYLQKRPNLVSCMFFNNEVGTAQLVGPLAYRCQEYEVPLHVDVSQYLREFPLFAYGYPIAMLSVSAHKIYGPPGMGLLFVRKEFRRQLQPLLHGGGHEGGLRSGTLPVPLIVGFAKAVDLVCQSHATEGPRLIGLRELLWLHLSERIPGIRRNSPIDGLPGLLNVELPDVDGDAVLAALRQTPVCASAGSACSSANPEPSYVLRAMGRSDSAARASLRFSMGRGNTREQIVEAARIVGEVWEQLRSPRQS